MAKINALNYQSQIDYQTPAPPNLDFSEQGRLGAAQRQQRASLRSGIFEVTKTAGDVLGRIIQAREDQIVSTELFEFQNGLEEAGNQISRQFLDPAYAYSIDPDTGKPMYELAPEKFREFAEQYLEQHQDRLSRPLSKHRAEQLLADFATKKMDELITGTDAMIRETARVNFEKGYQERVEEGDPQVVQDYLMQQQNDGVISEPERMRAEDKAYHDMALQALSQGAMELAQEERDWAAAEELFDPEAGLLTYTNLRTGEVESLSGQEVSDIRNRVRESYIDWRKELYTQADNEYAQLYYSGEMPLDALEEHILSDWRSEDGEWYQSRRKEHWLEKIRREREARADGGMSEDEFPNEALRGEWVKLIWSPYVTDEMAHRWVREHRTDLGRDLSRQLAEDIEKLDFRDGMENDPARMMVNRVLTDVDEHFEPLLEEARESKGTDSDEYRSLSARYNRAVVRVHEYMMDWALKEAREGEFSFNTPQAQKAFNETLDNVAANIIADLDPESDLSQLLARGDGAIADPLTQLDWATQLPGQLGAAARLGYATSTKEFIERYQRMIDTGRFAEVSRQHPEMSIALNAAYRRTLADWTGVSASRIVAQTLPGGRSAIFVPDPNAEPGDFKIYQPGRNGRDVGGHLFTFRATENAKNLVLQVWDSSRQEFRDVPEVGRDFATYSGWREKPQATHPTDDNPTLQERARQSEEAIREFDALSPFGGL